MTSSAEVVRFTIMSTWETFRWSRRKQPNYRDFGGHRFGGGDRAGNERLKG